MLIIIIIVHFYPVQSKPGSWPRYFQERAASDYYPSPKARYPYLGGVDIYTAFLKKGAAKNPPPCGLEPATLRLLAERANRWPSRQSIAVIVIIRSRCRMEYNVCSS